MTEPNWDKMQAQLDELPDDATDEQLAAVTETWIDESPETEWRNAWQRVADWLRGND